MFRRLKAVFAFVAAAGMLAVVMAQTVPMQTVQDSARGNRLKINGKWLFVSGMNIAWNNFARDVGDQNVSINAFVNQFRQINQAGGNAVRWWLHTDAQVDPVMNMSTGAVTGLGTRTIANIRQVLDSAYNYGVVVSLCLFSFDLLQNDGNKTQAQMDRNLKFLTEPANLDSYIQNALRPMLDAVGSHPAIMCWEVFNEPEGMTTQHGWSTVKIDHSHVMRFTNKIAGEVHRRTKKMASTGIHNFSSGERARYSDALLRAAGSDQDGWLDFYMAHYYPQYGGTSESPFHHRASYWGFDRPVLIGEFPAQSWPVANQGYTIQPGTDMTIVNAYQRAYDSSYCGAMAWSFTEGNKAKFGTFETLRPALQNLFTKYPNDIKIRDVNIDIPTGDLAMRLALTNLPPEGSASDGGPWNELATVCSPALNFSGRTNLTFEMYIQPGSGANLMLVPVAKAGSSYTWTPAQSAQFNLTGRPTGQWFTVTIPISAFGTGSLSDVREFLIQFWGLNTPYTGTVYFDNIRLDNTVIYNFNTPGSEWNTTATGASVSLVARPSGSVPVLNDKAAAPRVGLAPVVAVKGRVLSVTGIDNSEMSVKMINMQGKTVASFKASGKGQFELAKVPAGRYVVETKAAGKITGSTAVVVN